MSADETVRFAWEGIDITASIDRTLLQSDYHHIEVRAGERFPITQTGCRSLFIAGPAFGDADLTTFVTNWLNDAAQSKEWRRYVEDNRQLSFF